MLIFALELQDYTFGFSGINFLWEEMNGFPRGVALLFGPSLLFYLKAQVNRKFSFQRKDLVHLLPWLLFFVPDVLTFSFGPDAVAAASASLYGEIRGIVSMPIRWLSYAYYFFQAWVLLRKYRHWLQHRFSQLETVQLSWFRNFLLLMSFWIVFREVMNLIDAYLDLPFSQDWWWNLALAAAAIYVGISGLSQSQPADMLFEGEELKGLEEEQDQKSGLMEQVDKRMKSERYYLQPELSIRELAAQLKIPLSELSQAINQERNINFNDYINAWRIDEFIREYPKPENSAYTILSIALDCGFNSKATFNRAFKKHTGQSPKDYFSAQESE